MNVTRDVILDLAPLYLAGEASRDSCALVDEYLDSDPEAALWMRLERVHAFGAPPAVRHDAVPLDLELRALHRTRRRLGLQRWLLGLGWFFFALSLSSEFRLSGGKLVEFHFLARDFPVAAMILIVLALACWVAYLAVRRSRVRLLCLLLAPWALPHGPARLQAQAAVATRAAHERELRIDVSHSTVEFEIPVMYSKVRGRFDGMAGTIVLPDSSTGGIGQSSVVAVIRTATINTGAAKRDEHLRSSDFFDVERFPTIVFRSEHVTGGGRDFTLAGTLSMHGKTRQVALPCQVALAPTIDPHNSVAAVFTCAITVARADFGARDSVAVAGAEYTVDYIGQALIACGSVREGFTWLHAVARLLPRSPNAMVSVGMANERLGDAARAMVWYQQALAADSLNPRAAVRLRRLTSSANSRD